ncbi:MAG: hypothetical protein IJH40_03660 [Ruminococcus sp.]|uniref:hypothetical protein n=1 Tax=Ruminococcus sp. TaxID=41978 RepID=UPI0028737670|nr:hypothetical protein [Ruminococcus sp.]MBQ3284717.1 hypothetical protein [Ruminococcus sp.]
MKKIICLLIITVMLFSLAACSDSGSSSSAPSTESPKTTETVDSSASKPEETTAKTADTKSNAPSSDGVDVDLTAMSSTMVYSEVLNMQQHPENYLGKIVKMKGAFNVSEVDDNRYFACLIADATACCSTGIEFVWAGDHDYPDDYPEANTEITVIGTFNTYMEGNSKYLQLKDSEVQF